MALVRRRFIVEPGAIAGRDGRITTILRQWRATARGLKAKSGAENGRVPRPALSRSRKVVCVAFDGVRFLDVVGPLEVFAVANEQGDFYSALVATSGGSDVVTTTGSRLGADVALEDVPAEGIDTLLVAGSPNWNLLLDESLVLSNRRRVRLPDRRSVSGGGGWPGPRSRRLGIERCIRQRHREGESTRIDKTLHPV